MQSGMRILLIMGLCLAAGIFISGCTQQATPAQTTITTAIPTATATPVSTETTASAGMANPASVNCVSLNGTVEIKTDSTGGQYGMCNFANGTTCEEWALFRGEGCQAYVEPTATGTSGAAGMANPASVNCVNIGGTVEIKTDSTGGQYGMCNFANGTACEEWALYRGEGCRASP